MHRDICECWFCDEKKQQTTLPEPLPPMPQTGAVIGYARVSTEDQSADMQIAALEKYGCHRIFTENVSGVAKRRPQLDAALNLLREGDTLVIWKLDRLGRSAAELWDLVSRLTKDQGVRLVSLTQQLDTSTVMGRAMIQFMAIFAEMELEHTRERTIEGLRRKKERGEPVGRKRILTDAQIEAAQKLRNSGMSVADLAIEFNVSKPTIRNYTVPHSKWLAMQKLKKRKKR